MARRSAHLFAAILVAATLSACASTPPPEPSPTSSSSPTPSASATPTASPTATPSAAPSPSAPPPSNPPPQQVVGLTAETGGGSGEVLLRWTQNPEPDVVSYIVLRADSPGGPRVQIGTVSQEAVAEFEYSPFVDSEATVGYYRVRAVDSAGQEGPKSAEVCGASPLYSC